MLKIAGSGPSSKEIDWVDIATKKRSVPSKFVYCCYPFHFERWGTGGELFLHDRKLNKYYAQFVRSKRPPQRMKPSLGLCAVLGAHARFNISEVGLIGFDYILDGNTEWEHDAIAEKACIESLVRIIDLRT